MFASYIEICSLVFDFLAWSCMRLSVICSPNFWSACGCNCDVLLFSASGFVQCELVSLGYSIVPMQYICSFETLLDSEKGSDFD